jgi:hypothetical protein
VGRGYEITPKRTNQEQLGKILGIVGGGVQHFNANFRPHIPLQMDLFAEIEAKEKRPPVEAA